MTPRTQPTRSQTKPRLTATTGSDVDSAQADSGESGHKWQQCPYKRANGRPWFEPHAHVPVELTGAVHKPNPVQRPQPTPKPKNTPNGTVGAAVSFEPATEDDKEPPDPEQPMLEQQPPQAAGGTVAGHGFPVLLDLDESQTNMPEPNPNPGPTLHDVDNEHSRATIDPGIVCVFIVFMAVTVHARMGLVAMMPCIILAIPVS